MAPPSSTATTSVQVALRIRPTTSADTASIPARFQKTVIHAAGPTAVSVEASSAPASATGAASAVSSSSAPVPGGKKQVFTFDQVHPPSATQYDIFQGTARPLINRFLEGFNCTILAYGQTSSGKTFTMTGIDLDQNPNDPSNGMGIIPRAVSTIFTQAKKLREEKAGTWNYTIKGSFVELYNEDLIDLLGSDGSGGKSEVQIREGKDGSIIWGGLREVSVKSGSEVMSLIRQGTAIRRTNETDMNAQSSRSHAIFSLTLTQKKFVGSGPPPRSSSPLPPTGRSPSRLARPGSMMATSPNGRVSSPTFGRPSTPSFSSGLARPSGGLRPASSLGVRNDSRQPNDDEEGEWVTVVSKFHFVDLAGSERLKRTAAAGERIKEGISINSGLLALGNVISALGDPARAKSHTATHVPYRDSKLTRLLQDSLGGNAHTLMIACVSPTEWNVGETVNTLKYANRARNIKNRAVVNEKEEGWEDVEWLQNTVTRLRRELKGLKSGDVIEATATASKASAREPADGAGAGGGGGGASKKMLAQVTELQNNYESLREKYASRTEELARLRRELGEHHRSGSQGATGATAKYEEIVGPVIEEYEKTIGTMEAELGLNRAALRMTNTLVEEREEELAQMAERHAATELYLEELRSRLAKLTEREASTEAYVRDLEDKMKSYDENSTSSNSSLVDLRRELARYKDAEAHSTTYIADLEAKLVRSDESVVALQRKIEQLEGECERRRGEAEAFQERLARLDEDGVAWRSDLEERERRVRELEQRMGEWERKKKEASEDRERLNGINSEVEQARRSLEDVKKVNGGHRRRPSASGATTPASTEPDRDADADDSMEGQLAALQQTHAATLADLSGVTAKYRDALREISDLAAQLQEAKLAGATTTTTTTIPESASPFAEKTLDIPPFRRRLASPKTPDISENPGRRLFFRQAASAESLHARSLSQSVSPSVSQSQSLSQELSSARSRNASASHSTSSSVSGSPSLPSHHRPNLSISLAGLVGGGGPQAEQRSHSSMEKEIMRLQEVLREREAEITGLEASVREKDRALKASTAIPETPAAESEAEAEAEAEVEGGEVEGLAVPMRAGKARADSVSHLSPVTMAKFNAVRRSMQLHGIGHGETHEGVNGKQEKEEGEGEEDVDESLDRLNELMLAMAQKESQHKEQVDKLESELAQVRRSHDALTTLSRDQALNMSTELEGLRSKHEDTALKLEQAQAKETELLDSLEKAQAEHSAVIESLKGEHAEALRVKGEEVDALIAKVKDENEATVTSLRAELSEASAVLEKAHQEHQEAFGKLQKEHEEALERRSQEAKELLESTVKEHGAAFEKATTEHAQTLKAKDEQTNSDMSRIEEEYYNALTKLRTDHAEATQRQAAESAAALERLKEDHAAALRMTEKARDASVSESQTARDAALRELQDEHASAVARKEAAFAADVEKLRAEHARALAGREEDYRARRENMKKEHVQQLAVLREESEERAEKLGAEIARLAEEAKAAAAQALKEQQAVVLQEVAKGHDDEVAKLKGEHDAALQGATAKAEEERAALLASHAEEISKLNAEHEAALVEAQAALAAAQDELRAAGAKSEEDRAALLASHEEEMASLKAAHESALAEAQAAHGDHGSKFEEERTSLLTSHAEEIARLKAEHESAIAEVQATLIAVQDQHRTDLEASRETRERHSTEEQDQLASTIADLEKQHSEERETLRKDHDLLVEELATYKAEAEEERANTERLLAEMKDAASVSERELVEKHAAELKAAHDERDALAQEVEAHKAANSEFLDGKLTHDRTLGEKTESLWAMEKELADARSQKDAFAGEVAALKAELERTRSEQTQLIEEASKRESLVGELEKHRSVLAEVQENLQRAKDEKDNIQAEKTKQEELVRDLQAQLQRASVVPDGMPALPGPPQGPNPASRAFSRINGVGANKLPPPTPPPSVPPPPAPTAPPAMHKADSQFSISTQSSIMSPSVSKESSQYETPATSVASITLPGGQTVAMTDAKAIAAKIEDQSKYISEQEVMIKTLNKQLSHCESDLAAHMDLVGTLETSLGDSEKNLKKARLQTSELARERDALHHQAETLRAELDNARREVESARRSIAEEKHSYEARLDEERRAKERARAQLDSRMEEVQRRKSKFACL